MRTLMIGALLIMTHTVACTQAAPHSNSGIALPGVYDIKSLSRPELHSAIEVAYLDGQITKEEALRAKQLLQTQ